MKNTLKISVKTKPKIDSYKYLVTTLWWHQVTVTLEDNKTTVFKSGTLKVSKNSTPTGGQDILHATSAHNELLKKDQKNLEKNITSEKMNMIIPLLNLAITSSVCKPIRFASQVISRHHVKQTFVMPIVPKIIDNRPK